MWLGWQPAVVMAATSAAVGLGLRRRTGRLGAAGAVARELGLVLGLYAVWRVVMRLRSTRLDEGIAHGYDVWEIERVLRIANEDALERWVLQHEWLMRAANVFYATVHVPALIAFLVWLYVRHRDRYPAVRNLLAATTGICLVLHWFPVAPPRMYPDLGFVDEARLLGQSVYGPVGQGISNQVSALPSLHAAWAIIVGYGAVVASPSRWRWWVVAHPVVTVLVIVVTANHWWLDSIAAGAIIAAVLLVQHAVGLARSARRRRRPGRMADAPVEGVTEDVDPDPVAAPA